MDPTNRDISGLHCIGHAMQVYEISALNKKYINHSTEKIFWHGLALGPKHNYDLNNYTVLSLLTHIKNWKCMGV